MGSGHAQRASRQIAELYIPVIFSTEPPARRRSKHFQLGATRSCTHGRQQPAHARRDRRGGDVHDTAAAGAAPRRVAPACRTARHAPRRHRVRPPCLPLRARRRAGGGTGPAARGCAGVLRRRARVRRAHVRECDGRHVRAHRVSRSLVAPVMRVGVVRPRGAALPMRPDVCTAREGVLGDACVALVAAAARASPHTTLNRPGPPASPCCPPRVCARPRVLRRAASC